MAAKRKKEPPKILGKSAVLAFPGRFERPACRLGGGRSILLSYGNIYSLFSIMPHSRDSAFAHLGGGPSILVRYGGIYRNYSVIQGSGIRTVRLLGGDRSILLSYGDMLR